MLTTGFSKGQASIHLEIGHVPHLQPHRRGESVHTWYVTDVNANLRDQEQEDGDIGQVLTESA